MADSSIAEVLGGVIDLGFLGGYDRPSNARKYPWGDQGIGDLAARAKVINYPVEAVLEMAIAGFLDGESLSFMDCKPRY